MVNVLLVGGASPFGLVLARKLRAVGAKVFVFDTEQAELDEDVEFILGSLENSRLVRRVVNECQITRLFLLPKLTDDPNSSMVANHILLNTTALIEEVRTNHSPTASLPQVIHVSQTNDGDKNFSTYKAAVLSAEMFLHSYAISYRMDVRLVRFHEQTACSEYDRLAREILEISSSRPEEPAKIYNLEADINGDEEFDSVDTEPIVRLLIYGANGWIGKQFVDMLKQREILFDVAKERPGTVPDSQLCDEISKCRPSHVVCLVGRTHGPGCGNIDYLEGGPDKLKENVRDNLFAPWCLANICEQRGIHFTYLGTGCLYDYAADNASPHKEHETPNFKGNNYSVVKGFTDRLMRPFQHALNARIRLPINDDDSPRNLLKKLTMFKEVLDVENSMTYLPDLLPILLSMILNRTVGTINLVNPGSISYKKMLEIFQEESGQTLNYSVVSVKEHPERVKNRAQCVLDTSRLVQLQPNVLDVDSAVRKAAKKLITQSVR